MAHPKRKISTIRRDKRRTHDKLTPSTYYIDNETGSPVMYHRVCLENGMYRGKKVMAGKNDIIES
jgi:large subunit ribosomal protein L32